MTKTQHKQLTRSRRHARVRKTVQGTPQRPRLSVFKSNRYLTAQLIDDTTGRSLAQYSTRVLAPGKPMTEAAHTLGKAMADAARAQGIEKAVFDRGGFAYIGVVRVVAEAAREAGLAL